MFSASAALLPVRASISMKSGMHTSTPDGGVGCDVGPAGSSAFELRIRSICTPGRGFLPAASNVLA